MRSKLSPQMQVVKKEEKEGKIRQFIEKTVLTMAVEPGPEVPLNCRLLVRSTESPAARMLAAVLVELEISDALVRTIVTTADASMMRIDELPGVSISALGECRISSDPRLLEAHEQLVIGGRTVWMGDCMRRDPSRRDAYEYYSDECTATADSARRSFDKLWAQAQPSLVSTNTRLARMADDMAPGVVPPAAAGVDIPPAPSAATRH